MTAVQKVKSHQDINNTNELAAYICSYEGPMKSCLEMGYEGITITNNDNIPGMDLYELTLQQISRKHLKQY